ncbi:SDR family NAD(P)-dependent oxidoreductase [Actinoplanes sp. N902-109]|uniref:SDR family NAD(P)-dependent oxidoreductase n=1 Tax=Actinoplanes sp. (strain N902-109) TaxID=649831 RepID=UPI0003294893|nr:SDR family oxidoreductase [Actinoplanes sp. N902-109]AGL14401.1 glucose dehydrogenase [Actinoplanes sp. N902-109]
MGQLEGKTALVTGGSSGIGLAAAKRLAAEGAKVYVTGRRKPELDAAVAEIGPNAMGVQGDATDPDDLDRLFAQIDSLDVLFANAGGGEFATLADTTPEHFASSFDRNVRGTVFTVQKALAKLTDKASIIVTGSTAARGGSPAFGAYSAAKAALRSFASTWAGELASRGIRVNTLVPGPVETPGLSGLAGSPEEVAGLFAQLTQNVSLGRLGRPEEIANAVLFLASDQSSFMTGSELYVDGGEVGV